MGVYECAINRRTIRKFRQESIPEEQLVKLINAARLAPTGANLQPLRYTVVTNPQKCAEIFKYTKWAAYLHGAGTPAEGERPVAYIVVLGDTRIKSNFDIDAGTSVENILLTAYEEGIATCWLGAIDRDGIRDALGISAQFDIHSIVALGYPAQKSVAEDMVDGDVKYRLDDDGVLHVPKRKLEDIIDIIR